MNNPSAVVVNITSVSANGVDFDSDQSTFAIAATGSQTLSLTFTPTLSGAQTATLSITHNPTVTVTLIGKTPAGSTKKAIGKQVPFEVPFGHQYLATLLLGILGWYALKRRA